jgi:hypothetical protein
LRRHLALLLVLVLALGAFTATSATAKKKKRKKPAPVDVTYFINWDGDANCNLGLSAVASEEACADPFAGATGDSPLGHGPWDMPFAEGLPLTLDAAKPIKGVINVQSFVLAGAGPDVMGIGQAQLKVKLAGTSAGEDLVIGELTTDPYTVTPASADYVVEFEITPPPEMAGKVFDSLTLSMQLVGNQMFHGVFPADGTSTVTLGALK